MNDPKEPREWTCTDDSPFNNGWGYNSPEPREDTDEEDIEDENDCDEETD